MRSLSRSCALRYAKSLLAGYGYWMCHDTLPGPMWQNQM
jgi:hypothetical protein